ncbi:MAG: nodulation protein NfeD [Chloroflexi bacterium]|nr:nodulation protein NfeD [Chloroflexota bacterium]
MPRASERADAAESRPGTRCRWLPRAVRISLATVFLVAGLALGAQSAAAQSPGGIVVVDLDGAIDRVTARFLSRALDDAAERDAELVVVRLDTPGGLLDATRDMVGDIFASPVPVAVYVAPEGAQAASAGTFIVAAAGIAAMAPATNVGAAAVVGAQGEDLPETLSGKATQDAAAFLRSIAQNRGRNETALEATVLEAAAYSADEAVDLGIADMMADDLSDLLRKLDGRAIPVLDGERVVETGGAVMRELKLNWVERILAFLSNANVAFLFMSLGGLGLIVELWNPGTVIPGFLGVIFLVLGFAGLGQLPFSWAGVAMIGLAMVLLFLEAQAPGIGFFGVAGAVSLCLGGLFLVGFFGAPGLPGPSFRVSPWAYGSIGGIAGTFVLWLAWELRRTQTMPQYQSATVSGALVGQAVRVTKRLEPSGEVHAGGELWAAEMVNGESAEIGDIVLVRSVEGLTLHVDFPQENDREEI